MTLSPRNSRWAQSLLAATLAISMALASGDLETAVAQNDSNRRTPLVEAVAKVRSSVVNLRGKKTLAAETNSTGARTQAVRQVNGMGTGVIIDASGYILTNFHVVEDVRRIEVTLSNGTTTSGTLISHDNTTDLALVKIHSDQPLPTIPLGTSTDVLLAETVAALGNAYGYEDTVTRGIVSEIGRTVQVSDDQIYHNLLQTDAPINPGNSGGPLINLDGEMIGINVAVRVGAQGIAFAIPVNDAMEVAAEFLRDMTGQITQHGVITETVYRDHQPHVLVDDVVGFSAAEVAGLEPGDRITKIDSITCHRSVDFQRGMLGKKPGDELQIFIERGGQARELTLKLVEPPKSDGVAIWHQLGVKVTPITGNQLREIHASYNSGLKVEKVRPGSPASREGIQIGDILVAMHGWRTESIENLLYVLALQDVSAGGEVVFYIIRDKEPFFGNIRIAGSPPERR